MATRKQEGSEVMSRTAQVLRDEAYARALARGLDETETQELADRAMSGHFQGGH